MGKIEKYEDLKCWQKARLLVNQIFELLDKPEMKREYALSDQLKRASISVMTNIAEGFSRYHKKDFIRFLDYSQSSVQEVKSLLYIVLDQKKEKPEQVKEMQANCDHCRALTLALLKYLSNSLPDKTKEPEVLYVANEHSKTT